MMPRMARKTVGFALIVALLTGGVSAVAQSRGDRVVATIGTTKLTVGDIEARLARVPAFRLRELGATPEAVRRAALEEIVDFDVLAEGARADKLDERDDVRLSLQKVLIDALMSRLQNDALRGAEVSDQAVREYYDQHRDRYASQSWLKLWQIVLPSRKDAEDVLKEIHDDKDWDKDPVGKWEELAKRRSIDKTTSMKKGQIGFVLPDGTTPQRQVRVAPALYAAAAAIEDGQIAPQPVQDGGEWVIVSRRGTMNTPERPLDMEEPTIRKLLAKQQVQKRLDKILDGLRKQYVSEMHPERIGDVAIDILSGDLAAERRPGSLPKSHDAERPGAPRPIDGELR